MRIAVVNPPFMDGRFSRPSRSPAINKSGTLYWPFWLAHGVGALERAGHEVLFLDCPATGLRASDMPRRIAGFGPGMVVLDSSTPSINRDLESAHAIAALMPAPPVFVMVGTHASALPMETLAGLPAPAAVALGEYDETLVEVAAAVEDGNELSAIPGLLVEADGRPVRTPARAPVEDLDSLPMLADVYRRHLDPRDYFFAAARYPSVMTITSRGCPFRCSFCLWPHVLHTGRYRMRSPAHIALEFRLIADYFPEVREVVIEDDTFAVSDQRVEEVSRALIEQGNALPWTANVRANLSCEAMRVMREAGCRLLIVGYESGSQDVLDNTGKGITVEQSREFASAARRAGLLVHGCFMAGNSGETRESLEATMRLALELRPDTAQFFPLMVYPGTRDYERLRRDGMIRASSFDEWVTPEGLHNCVIDLPTLTGAELVAWCNSARRRFYLRPGYLLYKLRQTLRHPATEGRRTLKAFSTFRKHLFRA
ncbi:radical SAM protein [Candidatus Fermentibacterales bacterium]|nr:radical SAM protein [Candidatus Fermentibacterales bacterium]